MPKTINDIKKLIEENLKSAREEKSWEEYRVDVARYEGQIYAFEYVLSLLNDVKEENQKCKSCHRNNRPHKPTKIKMPKVVEPTKKLVIHRNGEICPKCNIGHLYEATLMDSISGVYTCTECKKTTYSEEYI